MCAVLRYRYLSFGVLAAWVHGTWTLTTWASCDPLEQTKLIASDAMAFDYFGYSVSIDEEVALVGAEGREGGGAAYVFRHLDGNWIEEQVLTVSDAESIEGLGISVSMSGNVALVGARNENGSVFSGSAYVFRHTDGGWLEEQKLTASDAASGDFFGWSLSISGETAIVGAAGDNAESGAAYVFRSTSTNGDWVEVQKLVASDAAPGDAFAWSVSHSEDVVLAGAWHDNDAGSTSGSAYVFRVTESGWVQEQKLTASDGDADDWFGYSVSVSGDAAVVGAWLDEDLGVAAGSAYIFRQRDGVWIEERKLTPSDIGPGDGFGYAVSINGDEIIVGVPFQDTSDIHYGAAYTFRFTE